MHLNVKVWSCDWYRSVLDRQPIKTTIVVVDCGAPSNVTSGGSVDATSTTYSKTAKYTCDVGHRLNGNETITCQSDGNWSDGAPECKGMEL